MPKGKKYRLNLFLKFSLIISLILVVSLGISGLILYESQKIALLNEYSQSSEELTLFVAKISALNIEKFSYYLLYEFAEQLQSKNISDNNDILSVSIADNDGKVLNLNRILESDIDVAEKFRMVKTAECVYTDPSSGESKIVGNVSIIFSTQSIYHTIARLQLIFFITVFIALIIIGLTLMWLMNRMINQPLNKLTTGAKRVAKGDFNVVLRAFAEDEIGYLADRFTQMCRDLKQNFDEINSQKKEIEKYSVHLEEMVKSRTFELEEANLLLAETNYQLMDELKMAQRVQESLIPSYETFPHRPELEISSRYLSMAKIGGDLYDIIQISENVYGFLIADVSGHGVPSALITSMVKVSFFSHTKKGKQPHEICDEVNREMFDIIGDLDYYLTAFFGILDLTTGEFSYTNAGHIPPLLIRENTDTIERLTSPGIVIGMFANGKFSTSTTLLSPNDRVLMLTDGIIEARTDNWNFYTEERLIKFVENNRDLNLRGFIEALIQNVDAHCKGRAPDDDRAVLFIKLLAYTK